MKWKDVCSPKRWLKKAIRSFTGNNHWQRQNGKHLNRYITGVHRSGSYTLPSAITTNSSQSLKSALSNRSSQSCYGTSGSIGSKM